MSEERMNAVLDGDVPRDDDERELSALMSEVREGAEPAPQELRARIGRIAAGEPSTSWPERLRARLAAAWRPRPSRLALGAGVLGAVAMIAVAVPVLMSDGSSEGGDALATVAPEERAQDDPRADQLSEPFPGALAPESEPREGDGGSAVPGAAAPPVDASGRSREIVTFTRISVDGVEALSGATSRAMSIARRLGGFTESSNFSVPNGEVGTSVLVLRVPTARAGRAIEQVASLGTVLSQNADLTDVSGELSRGRSALQRSAADLARLRRAVAADPTDAGLARELEAADDRHRELTPRQREVQRRASLATINLTLTTEGPVDPPPAGIGGSLHSSGERLAAIGVGFVSIVVLLLPFALIAGLIALGGRWVYRRRRDHLLSRT
ncbi:MAG: DUF4349 domain-containing protein [Miltoncostaeaceae bacterium]